MENELEIAMMGFFGVAAKELKRSCCNEEALLFTFIYYIKLIEAATQTSKPSSPLLLRNIHLEVCPWFEHGAALFGWGVLLQQGPLSHKHQLPGYEVHVKGVDDADRYSPTLSGYESHAEDLVGIQVLGIKLDFYFCIYSVEALLPPKAH